MAPKHSHFLPAIFIGATRPTEASTYVSIFHCPSGVAFPPTAPCGHTLTLQQHYRTSNAPKNCLLSCRNVKTCRSKEKSAISLQNGAWTKQTENNQFQQQTRNYSVMRNGKFTRCHYPVSYTHLTLPTKVNV